MALRTKEIADLLYEKLEFTKKESSLSSKVLLTSSKKKFPKATRF